MLQAVQNSALPAQLHWHAVLSGSRSVLCSSARCSAHRLFANKQASSFNFGALKTANHVQRAEFVEQCLRVVELDVIQDQIVGIPGIFGLSREQLKRLTIAVELVANPSIIFCDEPTSGLDARAAQIVMRVVRNIVNNNRTIVCTIHQPSAEIFDHFDELLLLKRGGSTIYYGPIGEDSQTLVNYFQSVDGAKQFMPGYNPATYILEVRKDIPVICAAC
jgi:ABC-type multidrug transport system ATPase subunit